MNGSMEERARRVQRAAEYRAARLRTQVAEEASYAGDPAAKADAAIGRAEARGDFDNLAYAGKPIPGLGQSLDPDWWVKELIQREKLTGLAPEPFLLRKEDAELDGRLNAQSSEAGVRAILEEFNARVINARRQLTGGPPVVTKIRDIDGELVLWRGRRTVPTPPAVPGSEPTAKRRWWGRPGR